MSEVPGVVGRSQAEPPRKRSPLPAAMVRDLRSAIGDFSDRTADQVQREITAFAGPRDGKRRAVITAACSQAGNLFIESLGSRKPVRTAVQDFYRRMGYGEASDNHTLENLEAAIRIGHLNAVQMLQRSTTPGPLSPTELPRILDQLTEFVDELIAEARTGAELYHAAQNNDPDVTRRSLVAALMRNEEATVAALAARVNWSVPDRLVVMSVQAPLAMTWPAGEDLSPAIFDETSSPAIVVVDHECADEVLAKVRKLDQAATVARSWAVPRGNAPHARRWVIRAQHLVTIGSIPRQPVVDCSRYLTQLWLQADPALRGDLAQSLLSPLLSETANSREILSSTLLVWLRTRESAPVIAELLGVHPQTVRYRWRKINELFGETLHDPVKQVQLLMVLEASLPLWTAGDQRDLTRYRRDSGLGRP